MEIDGPYAEKGKPAVAQEEASTARQSSTLAKAKPSGQQSSEQADPCDEKFIGLVSDWVRSQSGCTKSQSIMQLAVQAILLHADEDHSGHTCLTKGNEDNVRKCFRSPADFHGDTSGLPEGRCHIYLALVGGANAWSSTGSLST